MAASLLDHVADALRVALWLSLPALLAAWVAGLLSSGFASLTRLGDATTSSVPRQLAVALVLVLSAAWMGRSLVALLERVWADLALVGAG